MDRKLRVVSIFLLMLLLSGLVVVADAAEYKNYTTTPVSEQEQQAFLNGIDFRTLEEEPVKNTFNCFAVSEQGQIALGFNSTSDAQISVYNSEGEFLYGFEFISNASGYALFFEGEELSIYWSKSRYIGSFSPNGECIRLHRNNNTQQNADAYHSDRYRPSSGEVGALTYFAEGVGLSNRYARFTVVDGKGNQTVIYDVMEEAGASEFGVAAIFVAVAVLGTCIAYKNKRTLEGEDAQNGN